MEEKIQTTTENVIDENDTFENDDVKTIQEMQARFDAELAKRDQKYSALLKFATEGGKVSPDAPAEPTPEEQRKHIEELAKAVKENKINGLDQAKALLEYDKYVTENGGRTIFIYTDGTPSERDLESAERVKKLLQYAVETSDGSEDVFQAAIASKLKDIK